jgi:hypothetical protein
MSSPFLKTEHRNICLEGTEQTSFVLEVSLKNKNLLEPPAYIKVTIRADEANPNKTFKNKSLVLITHFLYNLINISKKKYDNNPPKIQKFTSPLENMGKEMYIIVKANTNALNDGLPYLEYCIELHIVLSGFNVSAPLST